MVLPFDPQAVATPCYVVDAGLLEENLRLLRAVADAAGCRILLAQKAFSMFYFYPLIGRYLDGTTASGLFEARLGREEMGGETHIFSPAYRPTEFGEIVGLCDHIIFNSFTQWEQFKPAALHAGRSCGIRVNPCCSTQAHGIYDPCAPGSRLGVTREQFRPDLLDGLEGLHFHTLCEQNVDALALTLAAVEEQFGAFLYNMRWLNLGGGHHITRADYDRERLIALIQALKARYGVEVYLEPGETVALNAGFLVSEVVDIVENAGVVNAILDASAACHMPDVIEMPYRPPVLESGEAGEKAHTFRLTGPTCLAGDIIGDYSFDAPLTRGSRVVFGDMAIYSMVKNNTFNGMPLPAIYASVGENVHPVRRFGYDDFKNRLS
ncbi:MAG: carboxynorspermidine decarboxylase [Oscillospiraceae bacterium]|nr:carboxynorspermidine decarboxylase [Oscillospiraceae bacterium]